MSNIWGNFIYEFLFQNRKALDSAKDDFESQDTGIRKDLPRLYEGRLDYFQPSYAALVRSQLAYNTEAYKTYAEVSSELFRNLKVGEEERKARIAQTLGEIKALSITVDDWGANDHMGVGLCVFYLWYSAVTIYTFAPLDLQLSETWLEHQSI